MKLGKQVGQNWAKSLIQFNREDKRMFGEPPRRAVVRLKADAFRLENRELPKVYA